MGTKRHYKIEEIEVPDTIVADYEISTLSKGELITIVEHLGYTPDNARSLVENTQATAINDVTSYKLYTAFKENRLKLIPAILEFVYLEIVYIDDCQLIFLKLPNTPALNEHRINWIREAIGPYYPERVKGTTIEITTPSGVKMKLSSYNLLYARQLEDIFEYYSHWLEVQSRWISPQFEAINRSIKCWLSKKLEGISPQKDEFIDWYVRERLGSLSLSFDFVIDESTGYIVPGSKVPVRVIFKNLDETLTPFIIQEDIISFGFWKLYQAERSFNNVLAKQALRHQDVNVSRKVNRMQDVILTDTYRKLFSSQGEALSCLDLLFNLNLIDNNYIHKIGHRDKYKLMAIVEVLQKKYLLPPAQTAAKLTAIIANQIKLSYIRPRNADRKEYDNTLREYISKLNAVSTGNLTWSMLGDNGR